MSPSSRVLRTTCASLSLSLPLALAVALPPAASVQTVQLTRIADASTSVVPFGSRRALHAGEVAFLGKKGSTLAEGIWKTSSSGSGVFVPIAVSGDPIPGGPAGAHFDMFLNPQTLDGEVLFFRQQLNGGAGAGGSFLGNGSSPLQVQFGGGSAASLSPHGIAAPAVAGGFTIPIFTPWGAAVPVIVWNHNEALPGDGDLSSLDYGDNPAIDAALLVTVARVNHGPGNQVHSSLLSYDVLTGAENWYANWTTALPGSGLPIKWMADADTDGEHIVFGAYRGVAGQGGTGGILRAPVAAPGGTAVLEPLAVLGAEAPDGGPFA